MRYNGMKYIPISCGLVTPCEVYIEGKEQEDYWVDDQNAIYYYLEEDSDDIPGTIKESGLKHWIIRAYKPDGYIITKENEHLIKYLVWLGPKEDIGKEWDFDNHCIVN